MTQVEAAKKAGLSARTIRRYLSNDAFRSDVRHIRAQMLSAATGKAVSIMDDALEVLSDLLRSESETVRLRAIQLALQSGSDLMEGDELRAELDALRRALGLGEP